MYDIIVPEEQLISLAALYIRWAGSNKNTIIDLINDQKLYAYHPIGTLFDKKNRKIKKKLCRTTFDPDKGETAYVFILGDVRTIETEYPELVETISLGDGTQDLPVKKIAEYLRLSPQQMADLLNNGAMRMVTSRETDVRRHMEYRGYRRDETDIQFFTAKDILRDGYDLLTVHVYDWLKWIDLHPGFLSKATASPCNDRLPALVAENEEQARRIQALEIQLEEANRQLEGMGRTPEATTESEQAANSQTEAATATRQGRALDRWKEATKVMLSAAIQIAKENPPKARTAADLDKLLRKFGQASDSQCAFFRSCLPAECKHGVGAPKQG